MVSVASIYLFAVLVVGYACLRSCRAILLFGPTGNDELAGAGFLQSVNTSSLNSLQRSLVVCALYCESANTPFPSTQAGRFHGSKIDR